MKSNPYIALLLCPLLCLFLFPAGILLGEEGVKHSVRLRWKQVRGSRGYLVEFRGPGGKGGGRIKVSSNRAELKLSPGNYRIRVAGLNKFARPGLWSDWKPLVVVPRQKKQVLELEKMKTEPIRAAGSATKKGRRPFAFSWKLLIPGYVRLKRKNPVQGFAWPGAMLLGSLYAFERSRAAQSLLDSPIAEDPTLAAVAWVNPLALGLLLRETQISRRNQYNQRIRERNLGLGFMVLGYALHFTDYFLFLKDSRGRLDFGVNLRF